jgi:hypothetical protein
MQVALVAGVGEPWPGPEVPGRADLARLDAGPTAADPEGKPASRSVGQADGAAVDLVDVSAAPEAVVGDPAGALDVPGMAGAQARHPDRLLVGGRDSRVRTRRSSRGDR